MQKGFLYLETEERIPFQFNPAELTLAKQVTWNSPAVKGGNAPKVVFQGGQSSTVSLSLTLDSTTPNEKGPTVQQQVSRLMSLLRTSVKVPGTDKTRASVRPAWVELHWGRFDVPFRAVVRSLQVRYTYFSADGTPLRARVDLGLVQYDDEVVQHRQNPTSYTPAPHSVHRLLPGETLDRVAAHEYGDPTRWRLIADANRIDDPLNLPTGASLVVPELPVRRRG